MKYRNALPLAVALGLVTSFACAPVLAQNETGQQGMQRQERLPAGERPQKPLEQMNFRQLDTNRDGRVSRDEFIKGGGSGEVFVDADKNGDGALTQQEFNRAKRYERSQQKKEEEQRR